MDEELRRLFRDDPRILDFLDQGALDGIWYWDIERPENAWYSPRFWQMFGYQTGDFPNTSEWWKTHIVPEDRDVVMRNFERHLVDPCHPFDQIVRYRHRDGSTVRVHSRGVAIRDATGRATRMLVVHMDVTHFEQPDRFRIAMEAAPNGMLAIDMHGKVVLANSRVASLLGYHPDEIHGRDVEFLVPEAKRAAHQQHRAEFARHPATRPMGTGRDLAALHKDGREVPVEIGLNPFSTEEGSFVLASVIDITERQQAEAARIVRNRELETLLHVISHDLREPLRSIDSFSALILERSSNRLDEQAHEFLRRILQATHRLDRLIDDVLMLSRAQEIAGSTETVDGNAIVREALRSLDKTVKETGARVHVDRDLPRLRVHARWAIQSVYNLVSNALRFTKEGENPEIEIAKYDAGDSVGFAIRDRGPGVPPHQAERIFDLFQRAVGREVEGTGAGLAIVRQVAESHGGRAWVEPRPDGGSEFIVTFGHRDRPAPPNQT